MKARETRWFKRQRCSGASSSTTTIALLFVLTLVGVAAARPPLIVTGWDSPSPAQYRQHLAEFERWGVFDGTTIRPTRRGANGYQSQFLSVPVNNFFRWHNTTDLNAFLQPSIPGVLP